MSGGSKKKEASSAEWRDEIDRRIEHERAMASSNAIYAIRQLGNMLQLSQTDAGFESVTSDHWAAIGIAIEQLSARLEYGPLALPEEN